MLASHNLALCAESLERIVAHQRDCALCRGKAVRDMPRACRHWLIDELPEARGRLGLAYLALADLNEQVRASEGRTA